MWRRCVRCFRRGSSTAHLSSSPVSEQAGSAGRRKRVLEPGAGEAAEDQQDCGVLLFSDRPDRCPVQPGEPVFLPSDQTASARDEPFVLV